MRSRLGIVVWMGIAATVPLAGQALQGPTAEGWQAYVAATEARVVRQRGEALTFSEPVTRGKVVVEQVKMRGPRGDLDVPGATINHWRGVVLIPGASLDDMLARLEREPPGLKQPDVVSSAVLESRPGWARVSLRLHRSFVLSAVFDTEHEVTFLRQSRTRASSQSTATRIVELDSAGTPRERAKRPDEDRGLLWRWNAYWRYEQVERGVLVECESLTLSRPVPGILDFVVSPLMSKLARESMDRTLAALRERFGSAPDRGGF
jgi:hypothetical protein